MRRAIQQALILLFGSAAIGLLINTVSPRGIPILRPPELGVPAEETISLADAQARWSSGAAIFLDARAPADYAAGHVAGALSLSVQDFDQRYPLIEPLLTPDQQLIAYCDGELCELSHELARRLKELGRTDVKVLVNGWTVWKKANLPGHTGTEP